MCNALFSNGLLDCFTKDTKESVLENEIIRIRCLHFGRNDQDDIIRMRFLDYARNDIIGEG